MASVFLYVSIVLGAACVALAMYAYKLKIVLNSERILHMNQARMLSDFENISYRVLRQINDEEYFGKQEGLKKLLDPLRETLKIFDKKITDVEKERIDAYSGLKRQINDLIEFNMDVRKETNALAKALSTPFVSGQWGEMQLRKVVELAGMLPYCDFTEQSQAETSRLRPDMIIKLPGNKKIIVDAKTPVDAYVDAINTGDEESLETHVKRIKAHIKTLGQKAYWKQFDYTPEFVLMFLPGEALFSTAIKKDPTLIEFGISENVIVTTPITLIALLKVVSFAWHQEAIEKNAREIGKIGSALVSVLEKLFEYSKDFERKMIKNVDEYKKISSFIGEKITPTAQKLKHLGLEIETEIETSELSQEQ